MNIIITVLYTLAIFALGFIIGVGVKSFLDKDEIIELEKRNAKLHKDIKELEKRETVRIVDGTVGASVDFSQRW